MKKATFKARKPTPKPKPQPKRKDFLDQTFPGGEKAIDTTKLDQDIPEEFREPVPNELPSEKPNRANWSAGEDRGEDLINERDPFIQQPEKDTQVPPELIQERAYYLYEQRGGNPGGNLADWFEAERQLRGEIALRTKQSKPTQKPKSKPFKSP